MALTKPVNVVSRFQDVIRCSVCNEEVGQLHCDTCQVYICKSCTGTHVTSDLSKQHVVVECKKRSKIKLTECETHTSHRCELYCKQCDVQVCSKCMASTHANHSVIDIQDFCKTKGEEIRKENKEIETSKISAMEKAKLELKTQIKNLPKQLDEIKIQVTKHGKVWHNQIEAIIKQFTSELEEMKKTYLDGMRDHQQKLEDHILLCRQILDDNTNILHSSALSSFNEYKTRIQEIQDIPFRLDVKLPKFYGANIEVHKIKNQFGTLKAGSLMLGSVNDEPSRPGSSKPESPTREADLAALNFDIDVSPVDHLESKQQTLGYAFQRPDAFETGDTIRKSSRYIAQGLDETVKSPSYTKGYCSPFLEYLMQQRRYTGPRRDQSLSGNIQTTPPSKYRSYAQMERRSEGIPKLSRKQERHPGPSRDQPPSGTIQTTFPSQHRSYAQMVKGNTQTLPETSDETHL